MRLGISVKHHPPLEDIDRCLKKAKSAWRVRRWQVIRPAVVEPTLARALVRRVGLAAFTARRLLQTDNRWGPTAIDTAGQGQRQRAYLEREEARAL